MSLAKLGDNFNMIDYCHYLETIMLTHWYYDLVVLWYSIAEKSFILDKIISN